MRRRRAARQSEGGVSLFPFIAVLLCTMGGLVVLLVLMVSQARVHAHAKSRDRQAIDQEKQRQAEKKRRDRIAAIERETQGEAWRAEVLRGQYQERTKLVADQRVKLGILEDRIRELKRQWRDLQKEAARLEQIKGGRRETIRRIDERLAQVQKEIERTKRKLEDARRRAAQQPRSYALIPYHGPQGTQRRPIYIECLRDKIVIQPEGVEFVGHDFVRPINATNPMAAALRAAREYWADNDPRAEQGQPYPLLIVRPSGTESYAAARAALKSWQSEFGYEMVGEDLKLAYPEPDPQLADLLRRVADEARRRQERRIVAMPSVYGRGPKRGFRVSRPGGDFPEFDQPDGLAPENLAGSGRGSSSGTTRHGRGTQNEFRYTRDRDDGGTRSGDSQTRVAHGRGRNPGQGNPAARGGPGGAAAQQSLAKKRGRNWALPRRERGASAYVRPIRVTVARDRLVIVPERGSDDRPRVVKIDRSTIEAIDTFVAEVWRHVKSWGIAGPGGYWQPRIRADIQPGGQPVYDDLRRLLEGSGIEVTRRQ